MVLQMEADCVDVACEVVPAWRVICGVLIARCI